MLWHCGLNQDGGICIWQIGTRWDHRSRKEGSHFWIWEFVAGSKRHKNHCVMHASPKSLWTRRLFAIGSSMQSTTSWILCLGAAAECLDCVIWIEMKKEEEEEKEEERTEVSSWVGGLRLFALHETCCPRRWGMQRRSMQIMPGDAELELPSSAQ